MKRLSAVEHNIQCASILELFRSGMDTHDISKRLAMPESHVYNLLHQARRREFATERTSCAS